MRIAFANFTPLKYTVETPYQKPLGGSESALCYLAEHLSRLGHKVFVLTWTQRPWQSRGVQCFPLTKVPSNLSASLDVFVVQNTPPFGLEIQPRLGKHTRLILWTQHDSNQPAVEPLQDPKVRQVYDAMALVSQWQLENYCRDFKINRRRCRVMRNAIAPAFENLFSKKSKILNRKTLPPILAYTSTPFRGLGLLLKLFPHIRSAVPGTSLRVYSSMKVYQLKEEKEYKRFYKLCRELEGVDYLGSLPQPKLAQELKSVMVLAYPNIFPETSCISVMEAMASGCQIITSQLGGLPETTAGFAKLIPTTNWQQYGRHFINEVVSSLHQSITGDKQKINKMLSRQVAYVNQHYNWTTRAKEWDKWLNEIVKNR